MEFQLKSKTIVRGKIKALTGIMVGGSNSAMEIGGLSKAVIRNPVTNQPYIPGSSLKGKLRSLYEISQGKLGEKNNNVAFGPCTDIGFNGTKLFGNSPTETSKDKLSQPSRIIVRDVVLTKDSVEKLESIKLDFPYTESKTENVICRVTSTANPRTFERIPAGVEFDFEFVINTFDSSETDEKVKELSLKDQLEVLIAGMKLLQNDTIGGGGSRGNGHIAFKDVEVEYKSIETYLGKKVEEDETLSTEYKELFKDFKV